jgi:aminopeptidase N
MKHFSTGAGRMLCVSLTACIGLLALAGVSVAQIAGPDRASDDNLTRRFAQARKSQVRSVDYELSFTLDKGSNEFKAKTVLNVELTRTNEPLSIDFVWKKIDEIRANGIAVTGYPTRKGSFDIPAKYLAKSTRIEIEYSGEFNRERKGFRRVVDPQDDAEYLFTDFEPYHAHTLFPCFDQPDLKATYRLTVEAPSDWKIIANNLPEETTSLGGRTRTRFKQTEPLSSYLFFLGAGPFVEWKDTAGDVPLFLYARQSLATYVDHEKIFDTTKKGLKFFADYFGYPYPFEKFGQIFVPEFAPGGMENPGAITLNERNIFRGPVPQSRLQGRDNLILHEMAHMWFGDLVTMAWWNDLWLNESFASYMAALAQDQALDDKTVWQNFYSLKTWGYWQDQLVTTHPIDTDVPDVRTAKGNFDGITYAKGASALKQLHFFVGEAEFRDGIRAYFRKFAFQNTARQDFIAEIGKAGKRNLSAWARDWLETAGPNRVRAKWFCDGGKIKSFHMVQAPSSSKTLSPHRTRIGLFSASTGGVLHLSSVYDAYYDKADTEVGGLKGQPCPDFVYPNLDDQDFALYALDPTSLQFAKQALTGEISDPLLRVMVWGTLGQMVRETELPITDYFFMALAGLEKETEESLLSIVLERRGAIRSYFFQYLSTEQRATIAPRLEAVLWKRVSEAEPGSSAQMIFFDSYVQVSQTREAMARLSEILQGTGIPNGIQIDQDRRWQIVETLAVNDFTGVSGLINAEEKRDPSTAGKRNGYAARVAIPQPEVKKMFWSEFQEPGRISSSTLQEAAGRFHNPNHVELSKPFVEPFFAKVTSMDWGNDDLVGLYFHNLFPYSICSPQLLKESRARLSSAKNLTRLARRAWLETNDELSKCIAIRGVEKQPGIIKGQRD